MKNIMNKVIALSIIAAMAPMCAVSAEEADTAAAASSYSASPKTSIGAYTTVKTGTVMGISKSMDNNDSDVVLEIGTDIVFNDDGTYTVIDDAPVECELIISEDTVVINADGEFDEIELGDSITAYVRWDTPATLSLPPQYSPNVVVINTEESEEFIDVDKYYEAFEGTYKNSGNKLRINVDENTEIVDKYGNAAEITDGDDLVVLYKYTTRSIPAYTSPDKVIVLGQLGDSIFTPEESSEIDLSGVSTIKAGNTEIDYTPVQINGKYMVPLRAIAEALGYTVNWDGELQAITINTAYSLTVGSDKYIRGKAMAVQLGQAPVVINFGDGDYTYVPVEYFDNVFSYSVKVDGDVLTIGIDPTNA